MIIDITESTLAEIKNPALKAYAEIYVRIYKDFIKQVGEMGIEVEEDECPSLFTSRLAELKQMGAIVRNSDKSVYINRISPSCQACRTGITSATFYISLQCHRDCFYCFNPNQQDYTNFKDQKKDVLGELDELRKSNQSIQHLALTGGEPLLFKDDTYRFFEHAKEQFPAAFTRLYTCGDHIDKETLQRLKSAGLDEIRFSIRMHDLAKGQGNTLENIALAKSYIPHVMIEMPVLPDTTEEMKSLLLRLDELDIFGINLLEFCYPYHNADIYRDKGYKIKARPYRVLYNYWYAGGLPVAGSEMVCLDLIKFALQQGLKIGVHYCSLENKHTGQIYLQNSGQSISKRMYHSRKDFFFKSAKVFGDDISLVRSIFDKARYNQYKFEEELGYLEFHVEKIRSLSKLDLEIGISSNVIEQRDNEMVLRELKLDLTTPQLFRLSKDV